MLERLRAVVAVGIGALALAAVPSGAAPRQAVVIALDGAIGPATAAYVVRGLKAAAAQDAGAVVLRLDTPGGLDSAMREIIRAMLASPVPVIAYVAPSGARAASAGTYILYASALAAMAPGTNLGAATPVSLFGETPLPPDKPGDKPGDKAADKAADKPKDKTEADQHATPASAMLAKVTNDAAAYIRGLASLHGRNGAWAERAVREAVSLPYDTALGEHVVDLVAPGLPELLARADGRTVIVNGRQTRLATAGLELVAVEPGWRDRLLGAVTDPSLVYLMLLAGVAGIVFELSHPGVIAPGVIGAICLLLGGYGVNLLPIDYAALALALLGLGLMVAEAFVPAFGALGVGGAVAFAFGSVMMFDDPVFRLPPGLVVGATLACAALFGVALSLLLRARRRPVVTGNPALIGAAGRATRWAGAEGEVLVQGERWHARATRELAPGQAVRVVARQGLTLLVEPT